MGQAKQRWIELNERNIGNVPDKKVCVKHFEDKYIKKFIRQNYDDGFCDYCQKDLKVVELEDLMKFIMSGISNFYEDAANFMGYNSQEGGYLGEIYTPDELIQEFVELEAEPFELIEDIVNSIEDIAWAKPDQYYDNEGDEFMSQWRFFKNIVKHKSRFLFSSGDDEEYKNVYKILNEVGRLIVSLNLIHKVPKGSKIYRCRQHDSKKIIREKKQMISPPIENAIYPNRFSPSGISMFYSAFDKETAILETVSRENKKSKYVTIAELELEEDRYVIDFCKLPNVPSIFGKIKNYYLIYLIHDLVRDFTKDIAKDGKEHIEYVPTQVVTEFFRFSFNKNRKNKIDGIIYPSSKNKKNKTSVFFWDHEESEKLMNLKSLKRERIKRS
ncbi:HEPN-associated N-terminal domain-containing protein [Flavobacterium maritimum]|uniref:HEPN-associated N-terminal domain-containing protein n=1 Tax=Flavobacterium maritimum TaxID=3149042 RepID=UPI0032B59018